MTLDERVRARLDELQRAADQGAAWTPEVGAGDIAAPYIASDNSSWAREVWLPSLRRRAERHRPASHEWCHRCGDDAPCPDYLDLCAEIGIDPEEDKS